MLLTDLNGPRSSQPRLARSRRTLSSLHFSAAAIIFLSYATPGFSTSRAQNQDQNQNVAEAARQERARKQDKKTEQQKTAKHVYTEEDLKRQRILTPEDQAVVEAKKNGCAQKNNCTPAPQKSQGALDANSQSQQPSLGEVARQLRKQKELQALQPKQSEPFHISIGTSVLAAPILPERPAMRPLNPPAMYPVPPPPRTHTNIFRRDPFARVPARPRTPINGASQIHPAVRPSTKPVLPAAPKISARPVPMAELRVQPPQPSQPTSLLEPKTSSFVEPVSPDQKSPALQVQPVHPAASRTHRGVSLVAPASIFPNARRVAPIEIPSTQPAAPAELRSAKPSASTETIQPAAPIQPVHPISALSSPSSSKPASSSISVAKSIKVEAGDSLWKLAQRNLGHANLWPAIAAANPSITDPNHIRAGAQLVLPAMDKSPKSAAVSAATPNQEAENSSRTMKVHKGDTLWSIAGFSLGRFADWPCLAAANPEIADPNRIFEGQTLRLPAVCQAPSNSSLLADEK